MRMTMRLATALKAGVFCACAATLISSVLVVLFWFAPARAFDHWYQAPGAIVMMCLYTSIPAGAFGFLCGILGGLYLVFRAPHIASRVRLLAEASVIGALLGTLFPLFVLAVGAEPRGSWLDWKNVLFSVAVGCSVSILYAAIFSKSLLGERSAPSGLIADTNHSQLL
jgi:hypothetical protein